MAREARRQSRPAIHALSKAQLFESGAATKSVSLKKTLAKNAGYNSALLDVPGSSMCISSTDLLLMYGELQDKPFRYKANLLGQ